jgi:BlaI family penicillinase repressor
MKAAPRISEAEWEVMKVIWKKSPRLASDIIQALSARAKWGPATVKTLLNRLVGKGVLRFEKTGKSYLYSPAYTEEDCRGAEADSFLHRVFDGSLSPMISHFVRSRPLTRKELDSLEEILRQGKRAK